MSSKVIIGRNLYRMRKELGFSQHFLAMELKMSASYLCYIERGEANATIEKLDAIARYFGIPTADLLKEVA